MFSKEANGYSKKQVDNKIRELMDEVTALKIANLEKDKLNYGLANALEKSREIEQSAKNLYDLKIQKINIVYKNLEKSFNTLFLLYPQIEELDNIKHLFDRFSKTVQATYAELTNSKTPHTLSNEENDTIRVLIDKISNLQSKPKPQPTTINIVRRDSNSKTNTLTSYSVFPENKLLDEGKSPADKFLEEGDVEDNAYAKLLNTADGSSLYPTPNESGFDLKEAVNPKQDLDEIMKAFNFEDDD